MTKTGRRFGNAYDLGEILLRRNERLKGCSPAGGA